MHNNVKQNMLWHLFEIQDHRGQFIADGSCILKQQSVDLEIKTQSKLVEQGQTKGSNFEFVPRQPV